MRNPIRLKNLKLRFALLYALGFLTVVFLRPDPIHVASGSALVVLGTLLRTWGAGHLVKNDRLTTTGPYAYLRHPLYAGTLLIGSGFALIAGGVLSWLLLAILVPWFFLRYFPRKERIECARLEARYGDAYTQYRATVPALFPALRAFRPISQRSESPAPRPFAWSFTCYADNNELGTLIASLAGLVLFALRAQAGG